MSGSEGIVRVHDEIYARYATGMAMFERSRWATGQEEEEDEEETRKREGGCDRKENI